MKTRLLIFLYLLFSLFYPVRAAHAITDPLVVPNNKYGIHIIDENDLENAAALVNSSGGDWGYVTIVIREDQRDIQKWNAAFSRMQSLHLIPILRIATRLTTDGSWSRPSAEDAASWADFLSQLQWVTKNRYIILFNEPNHAKEWGNSLDPAGYAEILKLYAQTLKEKSDLFFILPAGLDASAPNSWQTMEESVYLRRMITAVPDVFTYIDGWTSHSYPNPGFAGKVSDTGKGTLRTYEWELKLLRSWNITRNLPVFITETGWAHREGTGTPSVLPTVDDLASRITQTADEIWSDARIVAITPFVLNYQGHPFLQFSWQRPNDALFYPHFDAYRSIPKTAGMPLLEITPTPIRTATPTNTPARIVLGTSIAEDKIPQPLFRSFLTRIRAFFFL